MVVTRELDANNYVSPLCIDHKAIMKADESDDHMNTTSTMLQQSLLSAPAQ